MDLNAGLRDSVAAALAQAGLLPSGADLDALLSGAPMPLNKELGGELLALGQALTGKGFGRAQVLVQHHRRYHKTVDGGWITQDVIDAGGHAALTGECEVREAGEPDGSWNLITNAGRIFLHKQGYDLTGLGSNGLNYIALSNDTVGETATSTTLSTEIAANGLTRAQGTVTLPTGSGNQTTVVKVFTATGTQSAQKACLFTASSSGTMNHVLSFTQRNLINTDTLTVTFTITLG